MEHKEYIRVVPGSKCAILMIHGIVGTPKHFEAFLPLIPEDWNNLNRGFGTTKGNDGHPVIALFAGTESQTFQILLLVLVT